MKCIICLNEKPCQSFAKEHVFPEAIGGCYVINSVCRDCNSTFGYTVDAELSNCFLIQSNRLLLNVKGKKKKGKAKGPPNPIQEGKLANDQNQAVSYKVNAEGRPESIHTQPSFSEGEDEHGNKILSIKVDAADEGTLTQKVNKTLTRKGFQPLSGEEIEARKEREVILEPRVNIEKSINLLHGQRAVMKIAYELACETLGKQYLQDPTAELIRNYILDDSPLESLSSKYEIPGEIGPVSECLSIPLFRGKNKPHIALLMRDGPRICAYVRIFEAIEGKLLITGQADKYAGFEDTVVCNDPVSKKYRRTEFAEAIRTWENICQE